MSGFRSLRTAVGARAALAAALLSLLAGPAPAQEMTEGRFASLMDTVFGHGVWRLTGGYRTPEREDELRAQGAMTVRPGGLSHHSLGRPGAPGAFDLVVDTMSPADAAERLRNAGAPFARYQPKGAHGTQGPHLHLEPYGFGPAPTSEPLIQLASSGPAKPPAAEGRGRAVVINMPATRDDATASGELSHLRAAASRGNAEAQLELGRIYVLGYLAPRDFAEARAWLVKAVANPAADPDTRASAAAGITVVTDLLEAERAQQPARYASLKPGAADR